MVLNFWSNTDINGALCDNASSSLVLVKTILGNVSCRKTDTILLNLSNKKVTL